MFASFLGKVWSRSENKAKKKPRKRSDSSGGYNLSDIIQSPPSTGEWNLFEGVFSDLIFRRLYSLSNSSNMC